jgi:hypothetical protein
VKLFCEDSYSNCGQHPPVRRLQGKIHSWHQGGGYQTQIAVPPERIIAANVYK